MSLSISVDRPDHPAAALIGPLARILGLYLVLALYGLVYAYVYAIEVSPLLQYMEGRVFIVDFTRIDDYVLTALVTPLALLPVGEKITSAGQYLVGVLAIIILIPAPLIFVSFVPPRTFYEVYAILWVSIFIIALSSRCSLNLTVRPFSEKQFRWLFYAILGVSLVGLFYAAQGGLKFVDLIHASSERPEDLNLNGIQAYATTMFVGSLGGFLAAFAVVFRRYILLPVIFCGFVLAYGIMVSKFALLAPAWIVYVMVMARFFKTSMTRYCLVIAAPFLAVSLMALVIQPKYPSILYGVFLILDFRLYVVPAAAFNVYYDFFQAQAHPLTHFSHINLVRLFMHYPYGESISEVLRDQYHMGTYNASFIMGDGLAGFGVAGIPVICVLFALVLILINTCFRGLKPFILATTLAVPAFWLINVPLFTTLMTSGLGFVSALMLFTPRSAPWNK
jgi:hypothetical protein